MAGNAGSGQPIGTMKISMRRVRTESDGTIERDRQVLHKGPGSLIRSMCVPRRGSGSHQRSGSSISGSAVPGTVRNNLYP